MRESNSECGEDRERGVARERDRPLGECLPVNFMLKFPTCISTIWRNHLPHLTSK